MKSPRRLAEPCWRSLEGIMDDLKRLEDERLRETLAQSRQWLDDGLRSVGGFAGRVSYMEETLDGSSREVHRSRMLLPLRNHAALDLPSPRLRFSRSVTFVEVCSLHLRLSSASYQYQTPPNHESWGETCARSQPVTLNSFIILNYFDCLVAEHTD